MTFDPTFQQLSEAAADLPDVIADETYPLDGVDSDLSGAVDGAEADEAVVEAGFAEGLTSSSVTANHLPPLGA
jgi:hypothetical protein